MKTKIVRIGNSQGVRIPKPLLEETGLQDDVEIRVEDHSLVISAAHLPRSEWEANFQAMAAHGDDALLDEGPILSEWDEDEWEWK